MQALPTRARLLIAAFAAAGTVLMARELWIADFGWLQVLCLLAAATLAAFPVTLPRRSRTQRVSITLDITAVFFMMGLFGPAWAMLTAVLNAMVFAVRNRVAPAKVLFNAGVLVFATWLAQVVTTRSGLPLLVSLPLGAAVYVLVNAGAVVSIMNIVSGISFAKLWRENFSWMAVQHGGMAIAGFVLGRMVGQLGWVALLAGLPLPMLQWTFGLYARSQGEHTRELEAFSEQLITTLAAVVDARDAFTFGHSTQVARYSVAIAKRMGYASRAQTRLHQAALLHDIGKIGIPEEILFKPGSLTADEYDLMKRHAQIGYEIMRQIDSLQDAAMVAWHHHERWNGTGYPCGLTGDAVAMDSRIVGVADSLDSLLSDRPYRRACTLAEALVELERCSGTLYDPAVVEALRHVVAEESPDFFFNSADTVHPVGPAITRWSPGTATALHRRDRPSH